MTAALVEHPVGAGVREGLYGVAVTDNGAVWFTFTHGDRVGRRAGDGAGSRPTLVAAATESTVWVTDSEGNRLVRLGPAAEGLREIGSVSVPTPDARPFGVVALDDGTAWFTERGTDALGRVDEFRVGRGGPAVSMIAVAGDDLWFTLEKANAIGHVRGGDATIAVSDDGAVWVAQALGDVLVRLARDGTLSQVSLPAGSRPHTVAADASGGVWATLAGSNQLVNATAAGVCTFSELPTPRSEPRGLAIAPDAAVWVALGTGSLASIR